MRELKPKELGRGQKKRSRTPPGVRELKLLHHDLLNCMRRRTPPGVRELKPRGEKKTNRVTIGRTPPGVRELKLKAKHLRPFFRFVAPLPGCVN